jgi:hypothetical protein
MNKVGVYVSVIKRVKNYVGSALKYFDNTFLPFFSF